MSKPEITIDLNLSNRDGKLFAVKSEGRCYLVLEADTLHNDEYFPGMGSTEHIEITGDVFNALANQHAFECSLAMIDRAYQVAYWAHKGQFRRDGVTPYIRHPEDVAKRVAGDPIATAVAWLHDVLEDSSFTLKDLLERGISPEVVDTVCILTHDRAVKYEDYIAIIARHPIARKVKIADILSNLNDKPTDKQIEKYARALLYFSENP
jgi:(p)ppGpp synthase/HD superfamily hydrolase